MKLSQTSVLTSALLFSLTVPGIAAAQTGSSGENSSNSRVLEEVIVTATRREESLQDVALAVSSLSGETMLKNGFLTLQDIQYQFSGVQFGTSPNDSGFRLRGVGSAGGFTSSSEQNVATVVDNVVVPFGNPVTSLGDIDRVEVLKGPQGTQFGKNASSGVVNITTRRPELGVFGGKVFGSYASLSERNINASLNLPVGESAAFGIYAYDRDYDSYIENVVRNEDWGGQHTYGARGKFFWEVSDTLSVYLSADYSSTENEGPGQLWTINRLPSFANPLMAVRFGNLGALGVTPGFNNDKSVEEYEGYNDEENLGVSLQIDWELGDYSLSSISAYRELDQGPQVFAIDGSSVEIFTAQQLGVDQSFLSQELRIASPTGNKLEYIAGVYLSSRETGDGNDYNRAQLRPAAPFNPFIVNISAGQSITSTDSDSAAAFVDGKLVLTDNFNLIGGLRYQYDSVDALSYSEIDPNYPPSPPGPPAPGKVLFYLPRALESGSTSASDWSGRFGFEYSPAENLMLFATAARGYLGPTVTFSGLTGIKTEVDAQTVEDITAGFKSSGLDGQWIFNANVFFDKYKDLQTSVFNGLEFLTENAGGFEAKGFEFETTWLATDFLSFSASYTYSVTKFTDYVTDCPNSVVSMGPGAVAATCNAPGSTPATPLYQAAGEPLSGAPRDSASLRADFNHNIGSQFVLDASANYYYRSEVQYDVGDIYSRQDAYSTVGLNIGFGPSSGTWRVGAFARNLFDERFHAAVIGLPFADPGATVNWNTREGRRTVGVSLEVVF